MPQFVTKGAPAIILAPMEGVTDAPMRAMLTERGGLSFCVTEFLRVNREIPPARTYREHIPELRHGWRTPSGTAVQVQLLGGDPERLARAALLAVELGAPAVDLNFGCPAPTVNRHDGGATLLKFPDRIEKIVAAVRAAVPREIPVSAKLRLGWDDMNQIHENAERAARGGASWITIHGRTKVQGYIPPAYWGPIGEVARRLPIPVVANGEIWTREDFLRCRDETGCEHFMIGRSAMADPELAWVLSRELGLSAPEPQGLGLSRAEWLPLLTRFAELSAPFGQDRKGYALARAKQWMRMVNFKRKVEWFDDFKRLTTLADALAFLGGGSACAQHFERGVEVSPVREALTAQAPALGQLARAQMSPLLVAHP
jgi:tRNA-dihydrouridine synthase C